MKHLRTPFLGGLVFVGLTSLLAENTSQGLETSTRPSLEVGGTKGLRIFGICFTEEGVQERRFEGVTPTEVALEVGIRKCQVKAADAKTGKLQVRLYQNRKMILQKDSEVPSSGIEIQIPLGKKKK